MALTDRASVESEQLRGELHSFIAISSTHPSSQRDDTGRDVEVRLVAFLDDLLMLS